MSRKIKGIRSEGSNTMHPKDNDERIHATIYTYRVQKISNQLQAVHKESSDEVSLEIQSAVVMVPQKIEQTEESSEVKEEEAKSPSIDEIQAPSNQEINEILRTTSAPSIVIPSDQEIEWAYSATNQVGVTKQKKEVDREAQREEKKKIVERLEQMAQVEKPVWMDSSKLTTFAFKFHFIFAIQDYAELLNDEKYLKNYQRVTLGDQKIIKRV